MEKQKQPNIKRKKEKKEKKEKGKRKIKNEKRDKAKEKIELYQNKKYNCCFYSSFIFLANLAVAFYYKYYIYSALFTALFITSIIYHSTYNNYTKTADKFSIISIVLYGGYIFYTKLYTIIQFEQILFAGIVLLAFLSTIYLYCFGYTCNKYCFCANNDISNKYHSLLHLVSSIGHICIVIM